ncbi:DENN domain and WD repeat-containing protein SCD1 isoform X4 [Henckelia pumila]|uniref:DENN domain and WD repeat-containing protein SCD1 isoform X4 n=1 Tax=Henckelia pumila TaxID=405737 RepID=UPI003C6E407E
MARIFEYFVVCGIGPEIRTLDGNKGYHGNGVMYLPSLLDQYPPHNHTLYPPPPPQLPTCVLPAGVQFYDSNHPSSDPRSYPIVLTEGDGSKIYVSCIAFRDPVCEDIAEAYRITAGSFADKCICLVSRAPSFRILRDALEEIFLLCFSTSGSSKPLWDVIACLVSKVPLPEPGKDRVLFAIENSLLAVEVPPKDGLPHVDISFQPLFQCLDVDNFIKLFTAVLLERRILLRSDKYSLLTLVSEAVCHLIYPFRWQHVYIPLLFFSGVDYIDAPTPYMMGLHSGVDTFGLVMDGVVVVDLEHNLITTSEEIPPIPEPEYSFLRGEILKLLYPNVVGIDQMKGGSFFEQCPRGGGRTWGEDHDLHLRFIFLKFFASILGGYRNFIENTATHVFNSQAFLKKRSRSTNQPPDPMISQFVESQGFFDYLERGLGSEANGNNLLDKLQDAIGRGQNPMTILPTLLTEPEIITISDPGVATSGTKYCHDRFPSNILSKELEDKRKQILAAASGALEYKHTPSSPSVFVGKDNKPESLSPRERAAERERMVLDIKVKLQGLWLRLLKLGATDDPLSSFEYGTILALIESDAEGIGGSGFVECIRENIHSGWTCQLTEEQFIAVKELLKTAINLATARNDMATIRDALEVSSEMHKKDVNNVSDYVQRHLRSLTIWEELRFWEGYFDYLLDCSSSKSTNYATLVTAQLIIVATHMAGLGLPDTDAWYIIETIAGKNNIGYKHIVSIVRMLSGERVLTAAHDGTVKMWDVRTDTCVATVGRCSGAVVCMEYDDSTGILAAGGRDTVANIWDIRAGKQMHKFLGHSKWIRSIRMVGDTLLTGSDDWTARIWSVSQGTCDAVLACHDGPVLCVEYSVSDKGIVTGSNDGLLRFWENDDGGIRCIKNVTIHTSSILSINAGEHWLGIGAADNSMSLFHRPQERLGGLSSSSSRMAGWQLYRTPQKTVAMVRCVASDLERKRICSGGRNGMLRLWDATINI